MKTSCATESWASVGSPSDFASTKKMFLKQFSSVVECFIVKLNSSCEIQFSTESTVHTCQVVLLVEFFHLHNISTVILHPTHLAYTFCTWAYGNRVTAGCLIMQQHLWPFDIAAYLMLIKALPINQAAYCFPSNQAENLLFIAILCFIKSFQARLLFHFYRNFSLKMCRFSPKNRGQNGLRKWRSRYTNTDSIVCGLNWEYEHNWRNC